MGDSRRLDLNTILDMYEHVKDIREVPCEIDTAKDKINKNKRQRDNEVKRLERHGFTRCKGGYVSGKNFVTSIKEALGVCRQRESENPALRSRVPKTS